jgi:hypothetical protein
MNKGLRHRWGLFSLLFIMYINKVLQQWNSTVKSGIQLLHNKKLNTILYADDQVLIVKSENEIQKVAAYTAPIFVKLRTQLPEKSIILMHCI